MDWSVFWDAFLSLVPPILVGIVFWVIMRSILRADRNERSVYSKLEAEMRAEAEAKSSPQSKK